MSHGCLRKRSQRFAALLRACLSLWACVAVSTAQATRARAMSGLTRASIGYYCAIVECMAQQNESQKEVSTAEAPVVWFP